MKTRLIKWVIRMLCLPIMFVCYLVGQLMYIVGWATSYRDYQDFNTSKEQILKYLKI